MAGDIIVKIRIEEHKIYKRVGADLLINKKITLLEALTGFYFELELLDKKKILISTGPGEIISAGERKLIEGKGMPFYNDRLSHGNLIINFDVEFPKKGSINPNLSEQLKKILPGP